MVDQAQVITELEYQIQIDTAIKLMDENKYLYDVYGLNTYEALLDLFDRHPNNLQALLVYKTLLYNIIEITENLSYVETKLRGKKRWVKLRRNLYNFRRFRNALVHKLDTVEYDLIGNYLGLLEAEIKPELKQYRSYRPYVTI